MDLLEFVAKLREQFSIETTETPERWSEDRPSTGHCAVASMLIRERFGGVIIEGYTTAGVGHFWNRVGDIELDATWDQFGPTDYVWPVHADALTEPQAYRVALADELRRRMNE